MTIIEAYSVGTPVIGAQIGGIPEIVIDGKTGFQFTSADTKNLRNIILKANKLNNEEYATMSSNTIKFANETSVLKVTGKINRILYTIHKIRTIAFLPLLIISYLQFL